MAEYKVEVKRVARKELADIPAQEGKRILDLIESLSSNPRPRQSRKLTGSRNSYRLRVGDYRVLYQVNDEDKLVTVFAVGHRREVS